MTRRAFRVLLFLGLLGTAGLAGYQGWRLERARVQQLASADAFDTVTLRLGQAVIDLRASERAYVSSGQGFAYWKPRVDALFQQIRQDLTTLKASTGAGAAAAADAALDALNDAARLEKRIAEAADAGRIPFAADLVYADGLQASLALEHATDAAISAARGDLEEYQRDARIQELLLAAESAGIGLFLALMWFPSQQRSTATSASAGADTDDSTSISPSGNGVTTLGVGHLDLPLRTDDASLAGPRAVATTSPTTAQIGSAAMQRERAVPAAAGDSPRRSAGGPPGSGTAGSATAGSATATFGAAGLGTASSGTAGSGASAASGSGGLGRGSNGGAGAGASGVGVGGAGGGAAESSAAGAGRGGGSAGAGGRAEAAASREALLAAADLCTQLARVTDAGELGGLLAQMSAQLDAVGIIVWLAAPDGLILRAALSHGYAAEALARVGGLDLTSDNATARAFRLVRAQTVSGKDAGPGAIVVPISGGAGCVGVVAAELRHGREQDPATLALARIFAAQLAALTGASASPASPAAPASSSASASPASSAAQASAAGSSGSLG
jgi:trimeric autotransporter adhesin